MSKPTIIKIISVIVYLFVCFLTAMSISMQQDLFGKGDLKALVFWGLPLAVGISVSGEAFLRLLNTFRLYLRVLLVFLCSALLVVCWVYLIFMLIGPWINAFSFPVFYLWLAGCLAQFLFLDWMLPKTEQEGPKSILLKQLIFFPIGLVAALLFLFLWSFALSYLNRPHKELYLIPNGYQGQFRVVYGELGGEEPVFEEGRRVIQIPKEGVIVLRPRFEEGEIDHRYFMVESSGQRKQLASSEQPSSILPKVELAGSGTMSIAQGRDSEVLSSPVYYTDLSVTYPGVAWDDRAYTIQQWHLDSLTTVEVEKCRTSIQRKQTAKE